MFRNKVRERLAIFDSVVALVVAYSQLNQLKMNKMEKSVEIRLKEADRFPLIDFDFFRLNDPPSVSKYMLMH